MKGLNLSKFKKMHEDEKFATMANKEGHEIKVSKHSLSPVLRKQIEALPLFAEGGKTEKRKLEIEEVPDAKNEQAVASSNVPVSYNTDQNVKPKIEAPAEGVDNGQIKTPVEVNQPGLEAQQAATLSEAQAIGKQGQQEAQAIQNVQNKIKQLPSQADIFSSYKGNEQKLRNAYLTKEINPDRYWNNHSKVLGAIALALGGASAGLGGENTALKVIQDRIKSDVDAQKNSQDKTMNLWKMNRQIMGDDLAANLATQNQLWAGVQHDLTKIAAQNKGPIELQKAKQKVAEIQQIIDMNDYKRSLIDPRTDKSNIDPANLIDLFVPPAAQKEVAQEISQAKETLQAAPEIFSSFDKAAKEARPMTGGSQTSLTAFVPFMKSSAQKSLKALLGPTFQDKEGTVNQNALDGFFSNISPQFLDDDSTVQLKRKTLADYLKSHTQGTRSKGFYINLQNFPATDTSGINENSYLPQNNNKIAGKRGVEYEEKTIGGKIYMVPKKGK